MPEPIDPYTFEPWDPQLAAERGAALLDRVPWAGWRQLVDVGALDMSDGTYRGRSECSACVGAQLDYRRRLSSKIDDDAGEYVEFLVALLGEDARWGWLTRQFAIHYGFQIPDDDPAAAKLVVVNMRWERLTIAWQSVLAS
jgi:hypothetical protein